MGQYYMAVNANTLEYVRSWTYDSGCKLMEHSWMKNGFVRTVESLLAKGGAWHGDEIVWCGDYADCADEYYANDEGVEIKPEKSDRHYRYLYNEDKNQFVDKDKSPKDKDNWQIHPLPLLTAQGNGMGGGDYNYPDPDYLVGLWSFDSIIPCDEVPEGAEEIVFNLIEDDHYFEDDE